MRDRFNYYTSDRTPYDQAVYRVAKIRKFYIHIFIFSIALAIYILKTFFGFPLNFPPLRFINFTVIAIWGLIIGIKTIRLFSTDILFGKNWEEKKINEFTQKGETTKWE